jgi:hypothetical protein
MTFARLFLLVGVGAAVFGYVMERRRLWKWQRDARRQRQRLKG